MIWGEFDIQNGVHHWQAPNLGDEHAYLMARKKEGRILSDLEVADLPRLPKNHPLYNEWQKRRDTAKRFKAYLKMNSFTSALDIGCGNGWFTKRISESPGMEQVIGLDVNLPELEQAARVFPDEKTRWFLSDIFCWEKQNIQFDLIVLNASIQYFSSVSRLLTHCKQLLNPDGELHILDSPFYHAEELVAARMRSREYYKSIGVPDMIQNYHHHNWDSVREFEVLYHPSRAIYKALTKPNASPFPWLCFKKKTT